MFEPKLTDPHPESAKTYPQKVFCKQRNCEADALSPRTGRLAKRVGAVPLAVILKRAEFAPEGSQLLPLPSHSTRDHDAPLRSGNPGQRQFA